MLFFDLSSDAFSYYYTQISDWKAKAGNHALQACASSRYIRTSI
jgi:hypothetical protein